VIFGSSTPKSWIKILVLEHSSVLFRILKVAVNQLVRPSDPKSKGGGCKYLYTSGGHDCSYFRSSSFTWSIIDFGSSSVKACSNKLDRSLNSSCEEIPDLR